MIITLICEKVKTCHTETRFVGAFVMQNSGAASNEGSSMDHPVESPHKDKERRL